MSSAHPIPGHLMEMFQDEKHKMQHQICEGCSCSVGIYSLEIRKEGPALYYQITGLTWGFAVR